MKTNEITIFENEEFGEIRVIENNNEYWWVLKDVCRVLNIKNCKDVSRRLDDDEVGRFNLPHPQNNSKIIEMICVNESGLYDTILRPDKPQAKPFRKWVTSEVLPTIRKTGKYLTDNDISNQNILTSINTENQILHNQIEKMYSKM